MIDWTVFERAIPRSVKLNKENLSHIQIREKKSKIEAISIARYKNIT